MGIKKLIGKYSRSQGKDQQSLTMLLEQLAKTPMYFAVQKKRRVLRDAQFYNAYREQSGVHPHFHRSR